MTPVSMVMIARDNEELIRGALADALAAGCDELVVVDTGSLDNTAAVAREYGARVVWDAWDDNFGRSKNVALDAATHDWALVLDSDDRISNPASLRQFIELDLPRIPLSCHAIQFDVHVGIGPQAHTVTQIRMIKRSSGLRFRYPIHETIDADGHDVYPMQSVRIDHHRAYDPTHNERNLRILLRSYMAPDFAAQPHDLQQHIRLNLGRERLGTGDNARAIPLFAEYFNNATPLENANYWAHMYYGLATKTPPLRAQRLKAAAACDPKRAEAWVELARLEIDRKQYRHALDHLQRAVHCIKPLGGVCYEPDYTWRALLLIAVCADALGEHDKAHTFARAAKAKGAPPELLAASVA